MGLTPPQRACSRCPGTLQLTGSQETGVDVKLMHVATVAEISHGRELFYTCKSCGNTLKLLDDHRRGWYIGSIVIGAGLAAFGAFVPADVGIGPVFLVIGIGLAVGFAIVVVREGMARSKHPPRWPGG